MEACNLVSDCGEAPGVREAMRERSGESALGVVI